MTVRSPAVAGLFYPREPRRLQADLDALLAAVAPAEAPPPKAVIAPHAGYIYSGAAAAAAFATLAAGAPAITRVVLIGPAHHAWLHSMAAPTVDVFETPLGRIRVDHAALADLPLVQRDDAAHAPEHALEVELPFLQRVLGSFTIVPLLVGDVPPQAVAETLGRLWGDAKTVIVVSSDLSHYHDYDTARLRDRATAMAIEHGDWAALGPDDACGCLPIAGLLIEASRRGLRAQRLALCNSGDTAGDRNRVVGYGAWRLH
ncbi:AmmeMemoRadiSam system protein B [Vineibacter terrae]|uniref:AmmeMemoRadiSam system protein B n=1 Tax=Vineibacter terrae TaxID=2586908 RepID=UPI002E378645|nr:AmmeMemoRadiSam system protein B [Vineibacter terrae]HEX2887669.1 AmmeMemoRadiSam system protein B [Vineibacter terrae]